MAVPHACATIVGGWCGSKGPEVRQAAPVVVRLFRSRFLTTYRTTSGEVPLPRTLPSARWREIFFLQMPAAVVPQIQNGFNPSLIGRSWKLSRTHRNLPDPKRFCGPSGAV